MTRVCTTRRAKGKGAGHALFVVLAAVGLLGACGVAGAPEPAAPPPPPSGITIEGDLRMGIVTG